MTELKKLLTDDMEKLMVDLIYDRRPEDTWEAGRAAVAAVLWAAGSPRHNPFGEEGPATNIRARFRTRVQQADLLLPARDLLQALVRVGRGEARSFQMGDSLVEEIEAGAEDIDTLLREAP